MGITTKSEAVKMVNDFVNSPVLINAQRRQSMACTIVELAFESLRKESNLGWLRDLAVKENSHSLKNLKKNSMDVKVAAMRRRTFHKVLLWHNIIEVIDRRKHPIPKRKA